MITRVKHTAHVMLLNNYHDTPMVYLIQEKNKNWGIFGGGQEVHDQKSLVKTAARELEEETLNSLAAHIPMFRFLDTYSLKDNNGGMHKTFITINSKISAKHILLDQPGNRVVKSYGDILRGQYVPLYLLLSNIYKRQYSFFYSGEQISLRYFFAEAVRRNQDYLYTIFNKKYIIHTETRNNDLSLHAVTLASAPKQNLVKPPKAGITIPQNITTPIPYGDVVPHSNWTPPYTQGEPSSRNQLASSKTPQRYPHQLVTEQPYEF